MSTPRIRTLDVRPLLKRGEEPFSVIRGTVDSLKPDEDLLLIAPFFPAPIIELLQNEGFHARPERLSDGSWQTTLSRGNR